MALKKGNLDPLFADQSDEVLLPLSDAEGKDTKLFTINKEIESVKRHYGKESKKLKTIMKDKDNYYCDYIPDPAFLTKKASHRTLSKYY